MASYTTYNVAVAAINAIGNGPYATLSYATEIGLRRAPYRTHN
jgi:hypothetical protein